MLKVNWGRRIPQGIVGTLSKGSSTANATKFGLPRSAKLSTLGTFKSFPSLHRVRIGKVVLPERAAQFLTRSLATARKAATTRKKTTATKKKTTTTRKPAAKKTVAKKKPAAKKKKTAVKRKTAAKKKPAVRRKKVAAKKPPKLSVREHMSKRLKPPPAKMGSYTLFIKEHFAEVSNEPSSARFSAIAAKWKALPESEKETYKQRAHEMSVKLKQERENWLNALTPAQLEEANKSRFLLRNKIDTKIKAAKRLSYLKPSARVRKARNAHTFFMQDYWKKLPAGEGKNAPAVMVQIAKAWKALPASEKKPYEDLAEADKKRYASEMKHHK